MTKELLSQRRVWTAILGVLRLILLAFGVNYNLDVEAAADAIINVVLAISDLGIIFLPLLSYLKPKND